jgi:hypothetical protein
MATMIERVGDKYRICRRMSGALQAEIWNDDEGRWDYLETITRPYSTTAEERQDIENFKRRVLS